ncbi:MAG: hypothetical protein ABJF88_10125 [Rhodothermales bacterium]
MRDAERPAEGYSLRWAWRGALAFFVLAGLTGAFFRFAVAHGVVFGLDLGNVRHAHSHAMYFGWVTPALMALIAHRLPSLGARPMRGAGIAVGAAFATALVAYPPFLLFGYAPAFVGGMRLPLSVMAAGFNVLAWYGFVVLYVRARRGAPSSLALRLFDLALFFLVFATLGAWGLPLLQATGVESHALKAALTHLFLDVFSEGWFGLGVLGLAAAEAKSDDRRAMWGIRLVAVGVPFTFALGMAPSLVPPTVELLARAGGLLLSAGLGLLVAALWRGADGLWRFALGALALKALGLGAASLVGAGWTAVPAFRILYLHLGLLGFVSVGLVAAARATWGGGVTRGRRAFAFAVAALLASLVPLTPLWPAPWGGAWVWSLAALLAFGPILAVLRMLVARRPTPPAAPSPRCADGRPAAASPRRTARSARRRSRPVR